MVVYRVLMFCVVGALVMWIMKGFGADPATLPWVFVSSGLGAVLALDLLVWMAQRRPPPK